MPQSWPGPNYGFKFGPKQMFDLASKVGLASKLAPLIMLGPNIFFQTDIFSIILIGFIDWIYWIRIFCIRTPYSCHIFFFKNEHQSNLQTI